MVQGSSQEPFTEVEGSLRLSSSQAGRLQGVPVDAIDTDFVVPSLVWILVGQDLPVEPRNAGGGDAGRPVLDVVVARTGVERAATVAVGVGCGGMACSPFLHDALVTSLL